MEICEKLEQCSNMILPGTKSGENAARTIPISKDLCDIIHSHRATSAFNSPDNFLLSRADGQHFTARQISAAVETVRKKAGLNISAHGLRHSFGRMFVANGGSLKVLQSILGHSSSSVTDIYSNLAGKQIEGYGEIVTFGKK